MARNPEPEMRAVRRPELSTGPERALAAIGRIMPRKSVKGAEGLVMAAGIDLSGEVVMGLAILVPVVLLVLTAAALALLKFSMPVIAAGAVGVPLVVMAILHQIVALRIDERKKYVENVLPDFLSLTAANIRAGMQLDKALWYAAKPEFGLLAVEVELASKRVFSGETLDSALDGLAARFESRYLTRTIDLIKEGVVSGGEMASILEKTAIDLRDLQLMHKEISASMVMYSIFIGFSAAVGAPFLYVVSHRLISMFEQLWAQRPFEAVTSPIVQIQPSAPGLTSAEFSQFAFVFIIITTLIATAMISVIQTGRKGDALKYILPFLAVAFATFFLGSKLLDILFGAIAL